MRGRTDGFSLVELLTVLLIGAVVLALCAFGYGSVIRTRDLAESASRLRQWGAALGAYVGEHDGDLPRRGQGIQPVTQFHRQEDWFNALPPYAGEAPYVTLLRAGRRPGEGARSIFVRPGAKDPGTTAFLSYGMNMNLSPWNQPGPTKLATIDRPSVTVFLAESPGPYSSTYPSAKPYGCEAPHRGLGNILFLDGHVGVFSKAYLGVGRGDPRRSDVRWLTGTPADAMASKY